MDRPFLVPAEDRVDLVVHLVGDLAESPVLQLSGGPGHAAYLAVTSWTDPAFVVTPEPRGTPHDLAQALADVEAVREHLGLGRGRCSGTPGAPTSNWRMRSRTPTR